MTERKKRVGAKRFVKDVRLGKTHGKLMEKYGLSWDELQVVFERLVAAGLLDTDEIRVSLADDPDRAAAIPMRQSRRYYLTTFLPVYDADDVLADGKLHDISLTGMRVSGILTHLGEEKNLLVAVSHEADVDPLRVTAVCRWTQTEPDGSLLAGFEVTTWPPMADQGLDKITRFLTMSEEEKIDS